MLTILSLFRSASHFYKFEQFIRGRHIWPFKLPFFQWTTCLPYSSIFTSAPHILPFFIHFYECARFLLLSSNLRLRHPCTILSHSYEYATFLQFSSIFTSVPHFYPFWAIFTSAAHFYNLKLFLSVRYTYTIFCPFLRVFPVFPLKASFTSAPHFTILSHAYEYVTFCYHYIPFLRLSDIFTIFRHSYKCATCLPFFSFFTTAPHYYHF